ncbi:hypothetical protein [Methylobacterium sp. E-045]|uniref:hypothetical protein n=1 Tax=Methylobacterium sp. E-045 TaxID=2836575 RepID=UPI001FB96D92|nr:hypothetical protein [Methylobacterium sp. E-045]MCJ2128461.1 hypothetical protein [Methylobacterium sp. E-045]
MTITLDDVLAGQFIENGHINYGPDGSGWPMQHTTIPRLSCIDRIYKGPALKKAGVSFERLWCVDGAQVANLEAAIVALNVPPVFTHEERAVLEHAPADWVELIGFRERVATETGLRVGAALTGLREKGAIENELRTGEGRAVPCIRRALIEGASA